MPPLILGIVSEILGKVGELLWRNPTEVVVVVEETIRLMTFVVSIVYSDAVVGGGGGGGGGASITSLSDATTRVFSVSISCSTRSSHMQVEPLLNILSLFSFLCSSMDHT